MCYLKSLAFSYILYMYNRMTISDYNTKPVRGDRAIILKLHGFI